jgi:hypothetical protein
MATALLMLTVLAAVAGGAFAMSTQTFRGGRNAMVEQRAFTVAEAGLNQQVGAWNSASNLTQQAGGLPIDATVTANIYVANGDTAVVRVTRLDDFLYAVHSTGRASIPNPELQATRTTSVIVRTAYPSINPQGAITANGNVDIDGAAFTADGRDRVPTGWAPARCTDLGGPDKHAVAVPPGAIVKDKPANYPGGATVLYTPVAADPNTYLAFGTETMNTLIQNADFRYAPTELTKDIGPLLTADGTACKIGNKADMNWGEPLAGAGAVTACQNYFPIVYISGDAVINSNGRGQGILIVDGDLQINGNFSWLGLVLVRDDMMKGTGAAAITGAVMAANVDLKNGNVMGSGFGGSQKVEYSRCALELALRGSAILIRVRDRAWTQLF